MKLLLIYWAFLIAGYITGGQLRVRGKRLKALGSFMMVTVYGLCFFMGMRMGVNEQVTSNLGRIGLEALIITFLCICGSMIAMFLLRKILGMDRYGNLIGKRAEAGAAVSSDSAKAGAAISSDSAKAGAAISSDNPEGAGDAAQPEGEENKLDLKSTIILLSVVVIGMVIGAFLLVPRGAGFLEWFDGSSNMAMIILLCILMALVGMDMAMSGDVIRNIKNAGYRVLLFPVASMIGTMVLGICACLILGFTLRESAAIPIGFGWYSYAPIVIASAGEQYIVASAVSFMHNVIREVTGIILIPVAAKKFGYLEAASIPGIAAMDVCIPIVSRSCRSDTVIYSFAIGVIMCVVTSVGVPLIMGV